MKPKVTNEYTKYRHHKNLAKGRNIPFDMTFEEWWSIWQKSGKWEQRGRKQGQYVMSRLNDIGPYSVDNVVIKTHKENLQEAHVGNKYSLGKKLSDEHKQKIKVKKTGSKHSISTCQKISIAMMGKRNRLNNGN